MVRAPQPIVRVAAVTYRRVGKRLRIDVATIDAQGGPVPNAAVHVLVGRFSRTPHLGWVAAMYPLCGHALLGFVASSSESGAAAFAHGTFSCCPHNFLHATFHALPTSATLARAPACCALCPHIQCACVGTALCCLASTAVRCQCTLYKHHGPVCSLAHSAARRYAS